MRRIRSAGGTGKVHLANAYQALSGRARPNCRNPGSYPKITYVFIEDEVPVTCACCRNALPPQISGAAVRSMVSGTAARHLDDGTWD